VGQVIKFTDFVQFNEDAAVQRHDVHIVKVCFDYSLDHIICFAVVLLPKKLLSLNESNVERSPSSHVACLHSLNDADFLTVLRLSRVSQPHILIINVL
jgi:hypothetical protein